MTLLSGVESRGRLYTERLILIGIILVVTIASSSLILLVFLQNFTESTVRKNIYEQQIDRQEDVTKSISQSISSDLGILVSVLDGLANSDLLQSRDFASDETIKLVNDKSQRY